MAEVQSLRPILPRHPKILILGSMPGVVSLQRQEYYAHTANAFWPIIGELLGWTHMPSYAKRVSALRGAQIALWDVLLSCERQGSGDADIVVASEKPNAIDILLKKHCLLKAVFLNGGKACSAFEKHIVPLLDTRIQQRITLTRLPSTSPANAGISRAEKIHAWRVISRHIPHPRRPNI